MPAINQSTGTSMTTPTLREAAQQILKSWDATGYSWPHAEALRSALAAQPAPVDLQHVAVSDGGDLRWMTGRWMENAELYAMPNGGRAPKLYAAPIAQQAAPAHPPFAPDWAGYRQGVSDGAAQARQPLTDKQIQSLWVSGAVGPFEFARAIEAAHGIPVAQKGE